MERETILTPKAMDAVVAAKEAAKTFELARQEQVDTSTEETAKRAAFLASSRLEERVVDEKRMAEIFREQMIHVLSRGAEHDGTILLARVPYICQDVKTMKDDIIAIRLLLARWGGTLLVIPPLVTWVINELIK